jgi:hypothetical protein
MLGSGYSTGTTSSLRIPEAADTEALGRCEQLFCTIKNYRISGNYGPFA